MGKSFLIKEEDIKQLIELKGSCIASDKITVDGQKVGYMYRENPSNDTDSGWRFFAGNEDGHVDFDDGVGSIYISKADGSTRGLNLWDMDFTRKFKESAKVIYNYSDNK